LGFWEQWKYTQSGGLAATVRNFTLAYCTQH
jgi:hypothetical protein